MPVRKIDELGATVGKLQLQHRPARKIFHLESVD